MAPHSPSLVDRVVGVLDEALCVALGPTPICQRPNPATGIGEGELTDAERTLAGRLMRVDHVGEVCAQALYQSQAFTAHEPSVRETMQRAADEENDHLAWTAKRVEQLGTHTSYLNPLWYAGSFVIGTFAGLAGDRWSLGFLAETERQVVEHLEDHLQRLPRADKVSATILDQMRLDEGRHATVAIEAGAAPLPEPVKKLMRCASKVMTETAYWL